MSETVKKSGAKLLIVDDEAALVEHVRKIGEMLGLEVITASDGLEAWQYFKVENPDLVITDIYMPRMNGLRLMRKIKEANNACPVILMTGYSHYKNNTINSNNSDTWVTKPFKVKTMVEAIVRSLNATEPVECEEDQTTS